MGIYAFIISLIHFGSLFADLGLTAIYYQYSSKDNFSACFSAYFTLKIVLIALNIGFTLFLVTLFQLWREDFIIYIIIYFLAWITFQVSDIVCRHLIALNKIFKNIIPKFLIELGLNLSIIYLAINITIISDPLLFITTTSLVFYALLLLLVIIVSKNEIVMRKPDYLIIKQYLKDTKPLILSSILFISITYIGNIILFFSFGEVALAYFSIVKYNINSFLLMISLSISDIYQILYSKWFRDENHKFIETLTHKIERYSSILYVTIIIIAYINGELIFTIFFPNYVNSLPIVYILVFEPFLLGVSYPYGSQLTSGGKQKSKARLDCINYGFLILLLFIFIPQSSQVFFGLGLGSIGYSAAVVLSVIITAIGYRILSKKLFNISSQKKIMLHLILAIPIIILGIWLNELVLRNVIYNPIILLIVSSLIILSIYMVELILCKQLVREDLKLIKKMFNMKNYIKSLREEF